MITSLAIFFGAQLLGEVIVVALRVPIPGPVMRERVEQFLGDPACAPHA